MSLLTWSSSQDAWAQNWPGIHQEVRFVGMTEEAEVSNVDRDWQFEIVRDGVRRFSISHNLELPVSVNMCKGQEGIVNSRHDLATFGSAAKLSVFYRGTTASRF